MKDVWKVTRALAVQLVSFGLLLAALDGVQGAGNVVVALSWLRALASLVLIQRDGIEMLAKRGRLLPEGMAHALGLLWMGLLAWNGWFYTFVAALIYEVLTEFAYTRAEERRKQLDAGEAQAVEVTP